MTKSSGFLKRLFFIDINVYIAFVVSFLNLSNIEINFIN